ncbi:receptor-binding cancer antigen expressed on SiSo cells-like isoform X2 [Liolophura sinensis]
MAVGGLVRKLFSFLMVLLSPLKRLMCWMGRRRKNSGTILPLANHYPPPDISQSVPSNETELEPWDSWGGGDNSANHQYIDSNPSHQEEETEVDFFRDMKPEVRKTKKIFIRKKEDPTPMYQSGLSSRLAMTSEVPATGPDLGTWDESENAWGEEIREDLTWEAQAAIREKRKAEREQRHLAQQKKKYEREAHKMNKRDTHLSAVKLS